MVLERRTAAGQRGWWLVTVGVPDGAELRATKLPLGSEVEISGFDVHPTGGPFLISAGTAEHDIWVREQAPPK